MVDLCNILDAFHGGHPQPSRSPETAGESDDMEIEQKNDVSNNDASGGVQSNLAGGQGGPSSSSAPDKMDSDQNYQDGSGNDEDNDDDSDDSDDSDD